MVNTNYGQKLLKTKKNHIEKYVNLISPKGTETFNDNEQIVIKWKTYNVEKIDILFLDENEQIVYSVRNISARKESYYFTNVEKLPNIFKIRISASSVFSASDISPFYLEKKSVAVSLKKQEQIETNFSTSPLKIMPLGNSITEGYTVPIPPVRNGYRKTLKEKLDENGLKFDFVGSLTNGSFGDNQHEGHGGWHAKHWFPNYNYDLNSHLHSFLEMNPPDIILLHIGTNDIGEYYDSRNDNTIDTTVADISGLLDTIYTFNPNIKVILAKIINREDNTDSPTINETIETTAFNNALEIMANNRISNGDNLSLVDMESAIVYPDDLSDGVHPNDNGYVKMSDIWFDAIKSILPKLSLKIFLEGNYFSNNTMSTHLNQAGFIPINQPFNRSPWNYLGDESTFSIPVDVVDWVLVSLRTGTSSSTTISQRACFLKSNGFIVDLDGFSPVVFPVSEGNYYIVIEHRNHIPVMSSSKIFVSPYIK